MKKLRMRQVDVLTLLALSEDLSIEVYIDGGWGVDALLGYQSREHEDLDVALPDDDMWRLVERLRLQGFVREDFPEKRDYNFKMVHKQRGLQIDLHSYKFNEKGENVYGVEYIPEHLTGRGIIGDREVKTIDPEWMVEFHTWYEPDETDYHDVKLLCGKYNIPIPDTYTKFIDQERKS